MVVYGVQMFNGILGSYITNKRNISVQLMQKFVNSRDVQTTYLEMEKYFKTKVFEEKKQCHTDTCTERYKIFYLFKMKNKISWNDIQSLQIVTLCSNAKRGVISENIYQKIVALLQILGVNDLNHVSRNFKTYSRIKVAGDVISDCKHRAGFSRSCNVIAWFIDNSSTTIKQTRPAQIKRIIEVTFTSHVSFNEHPKKILLMEVEWYAYHPDEHYLGYSSPVKVYGMLEEDGEYYNLIPVEFVEQRCLVVKEKIRLNNPYEETVNMIVPLVSSASNFLLLLSICCHTIKQLL